MYAIQLLNISYLYVCTYLTKYINIVQLVSFYYANIINTCFKLFETRIKQLFNYITQRAMQNGFLFLNIFFF